MIFRLWWFPLILSVLLIGNVNTSGSTNRNGKSTKKDPQNGIRVELDLESKLEAEDRNDESPPEGFRLTMNVKGKVGIGANAHEATTRKGDDGNGNGVSSFFKWLMGSSSTEKGDRQYKSVVSSYDDLSVVVETEDDDKHDVEDRSEGGSEIVGESVFPWLLDDGATAPQTTTSSTPIPTSTTAQPEKTCRTATAKSTPKPKKRKGPKITQRFKESPKKAESHVSLNYEGNSWVLRIRPPVVKSRPPKGSRLMPNLIVEFYKMVERQNINSAVLQCHVGGDEFGKFTDLYWYDHLGNMVIAGREQTRFLPDAEPGTNPSSTVWVCLSIEPSTSFAMQILIQLHRQKYPPLPVN